MVPSLTEDQINAILRAFVIAILPAGTVVTNAQLNRVAEPAVDNYVLVTLASRVRLGTTIQDWDMSPSGAPTVQRNIVSTSVDMQLDFHGSLSTDNTQVFSTLFRSDFAYQFMAPLGLYPDYCSDGAQMPFINGEDQYETRWVINAVFDCNMAVDTAQQFANKVNIGLIEVDTVYPP